jgi:hypothetical protein
VRFEKRSVIASGSDVAVLGREEWVSGGWLGGLVSNNICYVNIVIPVLPTGLVPVCSACTYSLSVSVARTCGPRRSRE